MRPLQPGVRRMFPRRSSTSANRGAAKALNMIAEVLECETINIRRRGVIVMRRTILLLALVVVSSAGAYIIKDICKAEPVTVAATDDWLPLDAWHWPEETIDCVSYMVGNGDTLWGIVERYYPDAHTGEMVWAIRKANDSPGSWWSYPATGSGVVDTDPMEYGVGRE